LPIPTRSRQGARFRIASRHAQCPVARWTTSIVPCWPSAPTTQTTCSSGRAPACPGPVRGHGCHAGRDGGRQLDDSHRPCRTDPSLTGHQVTMTESDPQPLHRARCRAVVSRPLPGRRRLRPAPGADPGSRRDGTALPRTQRDAAVATLILHELRNSTRALDVRCRPIQTARPVRGVPAEANIMTRPRVGARPSTSANAPSPLFGATPA